MIMAPIWLGFMLSPEDDSSTEILGENVYHTPTLHSTGA